MDNIQVIIFYLCAVIFISSTVMVTISRNIIHALFFLILAFFCAAVLWIILNAEFLAFAMLFINVGALSVLFLFAVMILGQVHKKTYKDKNIGYIILCVIIVGMLAATLSSFLIPATKTSAQLTNIDISSIGNVLYTEYAFPFELVGLLLLISIVSIIMLLTRDKRKC